MRHAAAAAIVIFARVAFVAPRELQAWEAIGNLSPDPRQRHLARVGWQTAAQAAFETAEAWRRTGNGRMRPCAAPQFPVWPDIDLTATTTP